MLLGLAGTVQAAERHPAMWGAGSKAPREPDCAGPSPLYRQNGSDSGIAVGSQNFEASFDDYDTEAADDFSVTAPTWFITQVDVAGTYFDGPGVPRDETVTFYKDHRGEPGKPVASFSAQGIDRNGSFCIPIAGGLLLKRGRYWVSVVANMDFSTGGTWGWENQTTAVPRKARWRNPGGGFASCRTWGKEKICVPNGQGDHIFTLR